MKKTILIGLIIVLIGAGLTLAIINFGDKSSREKMYEQIGAYFTCDNDEWIDVVYYNHTEKLSYAELILSDGREITVFQAISASGARYLSEDETIEFWTKGDEVVSIAKNGEAIFENCFFNENKVGYQVPGIANPASVYCGERGGETDIRTMADSSQKGFCLFDDNSECDEWAFFAGECKKGDILCKDLCGDGICQEIVCEAVGCPCAETHETCPEDCPRSA